MIARRLGCSLAVLVLMMSVLGASATESIAVPIHHTQEPTTTTAPPPPPNTCPGRVCDENVEENEDGGFTETVDVVGGFPGQPGYVPVEESGGGGGEPEEPSYWNWQATPIPADQAAALGACDGTWYHFEYVHAREGWVSTNFDRCVAPGEPPTLPAVPTLQQVMDAAHVDPPVIAVNPTEGITGLESWFWQDAAETSVEASVDVDGWEVAASLAAVEWRWTVEGETYTSTSPGSEAEPAARHVFDTKGTHEVTVEIVWEGSFDVTGYGVTFEMEALDATSSGSLDYTVVEVVSVVDDPD